MNRLIKSICEWQTVLIVLLVAPVFLLNAELFQSPQHDSNLVYPIQFPQYIQFHQQQQRRRQQHAINNAKNPETLNSRKILSRNDDDGMMHINAMLNAEEKPVDISMQRIEQQKPVQAINSDLFDAKNKNAFFVEDGNEMRPHGQPRNVHSRKFTFNGLAAWLKNDPTATMTTMETSGYNGNVAYPNPTSFAERIINNLAANNVAVNFSQSSSPILLLPFDPQGTQYSLDDYIIQRSKLHDASTSESNNEPIARSMSPNQQPHLIIINHGPTRIYGAGTESKFPPFIEFFVQRIQKYFSVYKYEDLSRPALPSQIPFDDEVVGVNSQTVTDTTTEMPIKQDESILIGTT